MSEHAWTLENIAAFVAGGLDAAEAERVERHAAECAECAAALRAARALDHGLAGLFAVDRPGPALEDRLIRSLRAESAGAVLRSRWRRKLAWGAAAAVVLGATGAGMSRMVGDELLFPGMPVRFRLASESEQARTARGMDLVARNANDTYGPRQKGEVLGADWGDGLVVDDSHSIRDPEAMAQAFRRSITDGTSNGIISSYDNGQDNGRPNGSLGPPVAGEKKAPTAKPAVPSPDGRELEGAKWDEAKSRNVDRFSPEATVQPRPGEDYFKPEELAKQNKQPAPGDPKDGGKGKENDGERKGDNQGQGKGEGQGRPKGEDGKREDEEGRPKPPPSPDKVEQPKPDVPAPAPEQPAVARKVIRTGEVEFEVESFDSALATVTKLVNAIKGAYVGTVNSDKLANGKVKGSIVVRVPPDSLDSLVLDLRKELGKGGELKGQRIGSLDITKQYTDLESRLKAARTMQERLLQIIKEGKGEIKQLLEAEKELGNWRTKIEELEGEIRYYANQVALSTLTVTLAEKEIRAAAELVECEHVSAGVEVEDVDKAMREALAAVAEAKGRVTKSELKQQSAGQYSAVLQFEVAPEAAGRLRDRLRQLGAMVRLEIDRVQQAEGGSAPAPRDAKVRRGDTRFDVALYNLEKVAPRETATVQLAVADVPAGYRALRDAVERAKGRVVTAQLDEQDPQHVKAQLDFEVRRAEEGALQAALTAAGEVLSRNVTRAPEAANLTDAKVLFRTTLLSAAAIAPRETVTLGVEVADVEKARDLMKAQVAEAKGRTIDESVAHERSGRVTARLVYDVPLSAESGLVEKFKGTGTVRVQQTARDPRAADGKLALARIDVTLSNAELIVPRDDGLWPQVRKGLSYSMTVLSWSVTWLIFGLCVLLPWALVGYGGYRVVRRLSRSPAPAPAAPTPAP
jgi:hypothetical protein